MHRGLDPTTLPAKYALVYAENREDYWEMHKNMLLHVAVKIFGEE